ncbi:MAG: glutathione-dependent formaldehyde dehydrogenase [Deltaproteobacteria bacterium]|nr:glutathione-dependent formaldehyde dehydrogenase [Deltaproteobacteria bacterium]
MKAVVFHDIGDIRIDDVPDPEIIEDSDAVVRITASAICGTDLHLVRGTVPGMKAGTVLGHEGVGIVEEVGKNVRNFQPGDRVVIPSTIACGYCSYCRSAYYAQCDNANPNGKRAGTAFYGGPAETGSFNGLQAEYARVPFASLGMVRIPDDVSDEQAIMISDIFPTGFFGAELAEIEDGDTVAIFGCGPVGQFAIASAKLKNAGRLIAIDCVPSRLEAARAQNAEVINFNEEDPVEVILSLTGGIGVDRVIDAVGVDSVAPNGGPAKRQMEKLKDEFKRQLSEVAPKTNVQNGHWVPGDAPSLVPHWACKALAKAGTLSVIGVYPKSHKFFPFGEFMNKNLTLKAGNCNHRKYIPYLLDLTQNGTIDPAEVLTQSESVLHAVEAYESFDTRAPGWIKVELEPQLHA